MSRLLRDQRGAIMVMALFMAIFASGCLYYVMGIAETIAHRERMQDAADAAAFSAAVLHARGMNVIALINMTMAALLAVLIALRLLELVSFGGIALSVGFAFPTYGASLPTVPVFTNLGVVAMEAYEVAQPVVHTTLRALRLAAHGVRIAIPWVAQARTVSTVMEHYRPPASFGFVVPGSITLPTRDGTFDDLCTKAGEYVGDLIAFSVSPIPTFGFPISEVTSAAIDTGSGYFCGSEGGSTPALTIERKITHPLLPKAVACDEYAKSEAPDQAHHAALCAEAEQETLAADAAIDPLTGACVGSECGADGLYELRATRALSACAPRPAAEERQLSNFSWQAHRFKRRYVWVDDHWEVDEAIVAGSEGYQLHGDTRRPCGTEAATVSAEWNTDRRLGSERVPVCSDVALPSGAPGYGGLYREVEHVEVMEVFRCLDTFEERRELSSGAGELGASDDGADMAPQLIAEGAVPGGEPFQLRAVVVGSAPSTSPEPLLSILRSEEAKENERANLLWAPARALAQLSIAQAELYFDSAGADPAQHLWTMRWTARLRRFRLPASEPSPRSADDLADAAAHAIGLVAGTFEDACALVATGGFPCSELDIESFADLIAH